MISHDFRDFPWFLVISMISVIFVITTDLQWFLVIHNDFIWFPMISLISIDFPWFLWFLMMFFIRCDFSWFPPISLISVDFMDFYGFHGFLLILSCSCATFIVSKRLDWQLSNVIVYARHNKHFCIGPARRWPML